MEFLSEILVKYWKEVIVAVMSAATLPFIRRYVRKWRARVIAFFTVKKRLRAALLDAGNMRKEAEGLRAELEQERKTREELERKYKAESEERRKTQEEAERLRSASAPKVSKLMRTFNIFSGRKEAEENTNAQNEEIARLKSALENAERLRQNEAELKRMALAAVERLNGLLAQAKQELKAIKDAKPAPGSLTAKLLELLKACNGLPYPQYTDFWRVPSEVRGFLPPKGEVLRMKIVGAAESYISDYDTSSDKSTREAKCTVFYVLMLITQGVSDGLITIDDSKRLTWKRAGELLDKVNAEYFNEHPEVDEPDDDEESDGKNFIAGAFGSYPPEVILEDNKFIDDLLASAKHHN